MQERLIMGQKSIILWAVVDVRADSVLFVDYDRSKAFDFLKSVTDKSGGTLFAFASKDYQIWRFEHYDYSAKHDFCRSCQDRTCEILSTETTNNEEK